MKSDAAKESKSKLPYLPINHLAMVLRRLSKDIPPKENTSWFNYDSAKKIINEQKANTHDGREKV